MKNRSVSTFIKEFMEIDKRINQFYQDKFKQWGLTTNAYLALDLLQNRPEGIEPAQLADELGIQRQLVTLIINDFDKRGFILKKENKTDHRRKQILLNKKGTRFVKEVIDQVMETDSRALMPFTDSELSLMLDFHQRYYDNLCNQ